MMLLSMNIYEENGAKSQCVRLERIHTLWKTCHSWPRGKNSWNHRSCFPSLLSPPHNSWIICCLWNILGTSTHLCFCFWLSGCSMSFSLHHWVRWSSLFQAQAKCTSPVRPTPRTRDPGQIDHSYCCYRADCNLWLFQVLFLPLTGKVILANFGPSVSLSTK